MKFSMISLLLWLCLASCNSQPTAPKKQADAVKSEIQKSRPGTVSTEAQGWTMTAVIDGKKWSAASMMPPQAASRIIGYYKDGYIGLPYDKSDMAAGKKIKLSANNAADLAISDEEGTWGSLEGGIEIIKVSGGWAEGTFYFTAGSTRSSKKVNVKDGFFRVSL